jgi:hypothetical protein
VIVERLPEMEFGGVETVSPAFRSFDDAAVKVNIEVHIDRKY